MRKLIFLVFIFLTINPGFGQGYFNKWYFGYNAGLDFNTSPPTPISGALYAYEGCASISDYYGNFLFSTDGMTVWNAKQLVMPNGTGLLGINTSTQAALIVPNPGNAKQYYIFTTQAGNGASYYSIVDMTLDGGLEDVTSTKNIVLHSKSTEKITAIRISDGSGFWIIGHEPYNNVFFAYKLLVTGIDTTPVLSTVGSVLPPGLTYEGCLKPSHKGNKLAIAYSPNDFFEIFDFDNSTGKITNAITIPSLPNIYGVEFSPDDSRLYLTRWLTGYLYQVNMNAGSNTAIINSLKLIANTNIQIGALQAGPDGKIYVANYTTKTLGVINKPNELDTLCNYVEKQISLSSGTCQEGLPNFFETNSCSIARINLGKDTTLCQGDTLKLVATTLNANYLWQDSTTKPTFEVTKQGTYWVKVSVNNCETIDTINIKYNTYPKVDLGKDTTLCKGKSLILNATVSNATYLWQDNSTDSTFTVTHKGIYYVKVIVNSCSTNDTIQVKYDSVPSIHMVKDTNLCKGDTILLNATNKNVSYLWQDNSTSATLNVSQQGVYWVKETNECGSTIDTINVTYTPLPTVNLGNDTTICEGTILNLNATSANATYLWQDTTTNPIFTIKNQGTYWVVVKNKCGFITDTITVKMKDCTCYIYVPNAFTPNADKINDKFSPISNCGYYEYNFMIYNRWGEKIFGTNNSTQYWDGTYKGVKSPVGVYLYIVTYKFDNGTDGLKYGSFNLMR